MSNIVVGPWGGYGGFAWNDGKYAGIREIIIYHSGCIDSICLVYDDDGEPVRSQTHGGSGGERAEIKLEYPEEFLVGVRGSYHPFYSTTPVLRSLMFRSNLRTFGPYGSEDGTPFVFQMEGGQIVGFKGMSGRFLDALGFYISSAPTKQKTLKIQRQTPAYFGIAK